MKITFKCPHCGQTFSADKLNGDKTPTHAFETKVCPGAGQKARNAKDARPLGKDLPESMRA